MSQTPETVREHLRVWKNRVNQTAHCMVDGNIYSSDKTREFIRYGTISESLMFVHLGVGVIWFGYSASSVLKDLYQFTKGWIIDEKQNLDEIAKYRGSEKYSSPLKDLIFLLELDN